MPINDASTGWGSRQEPADGAPGADGQPSGAPDGGTDGGAAGAMPAAQEMMDTDAAKYSMHYIAWMEAPATHSAGIGAQTMEYVTSKLTEEETGGAMEAVMDGETAAPFVKFYGDVAALRAKTDNVQVIKADLSSPAASRRYGELGHAWSGGIHVDASEGGKGTEKGHWTLVEGDSLW